MDAPSTASATRVGDVPEAPPPALARASRRAAANVEPSVLVVGADETMLPGLTAALQRHRVHIETTSSDEVVSSVVVAAPDLILLVGDAAQDCGAETLRRLSSSPLSSVVPVAILDDNTALDARLRAFRHGAAAVIPRSASVDAIADQIARLAREIPDRGSESLGVVGEATLEEFVGALSNELRSGILTVSAGEGHEQDAVRLVLGSGRPLAHFIDDFVTRVRRHVVLAEPLRYEFDERAGGTVQLLGGESAEVERSAGDIRGLRVALADDDTARADNVAQELRQHGANVVVTDLNPPDVRFARLRQVDPAILLIGESHLQGAGYDLIRRMRHDTRLRWASLLVVRWNEVWSEQAKVPAVVRLKGTLAALAEPERAIRQRAETATSFDSRLEIIGPARCLRALIGVSHKVRATFHNPRARIEVDLSDGLVVGATGQILEDPPRPVEGPLALSTALVLSSGRVHVERVQQPATTNIMATIDVALDLAEGEGPPIAPSLPVIHGIASSEPPPGLTSAALHERPSPTHSWLEVEQGPNGARVSPATALRLVLVATLISCLVVFVLYLFKARRHESTASQPVTAVAKAPAAVAKVPAPALSQAEKSAANALPPAAPAASAPAEPPAAPQNEDPEPAGESAESESEKPAESAPEAVPEKPAVAAPSPVDEPGPETAAAQPSRLPAIREPMPRSLNCAVLASGPTPPRKQLLTESMQQVQRARRELVRGDLDAAQGAFCRATQWDKGNVDALTGLSRLLLLRRDARGAARYARKALKLRPRDVQIQALLGDSLARLGDLRSARAAWLSASNAEGHDKRSMAAAARREMVVAQRAIEQRDSGRAERFYRRAALLDPESPDAAAGLSRSLLLIGDTRSAMAWAKRASLLAPKSAAVRVLIGDVLTQSGEKARAEAEWRAALDLDPNNMDAQIRIRRLERAH